MPSTAVSATSVWLTLTTTVFGSTLVSAQGTTGKNLSLSLSLSLSL